MLPSGMSVLELDKAGLCSLPPFQAHLATSHANTGTFLSLKKLPVPMRNDSPAGPHATELPHLSNLHRTAQVSSWLLYLAWPCKLDAPRS